MTKISDDSHDYNTLEPASRRETPRLGNGCVSTGFVAALGAALLTIGATIASRAHIPAYILCALGIFFLVAAGRNGYRHFGGGITVMIFVLSITLGSCVVLTYTHNSHRPAVNTRLACQSNLRQLGLVCLMYANEHPNDKMPQLSNRAGRLMFENDVSDALPIYPELVSDLSILYCPVAGDRPDPKALTPEIAFDDHSYFYLGYAIANQEQLEAFAEAYRATVASGGAFADDIEARGITLHRLKHLRYTGHGPAPEEYVASSEIPMLIERANAHVPGGGNVLYADGHVEFVKTNSKWPMTQEAFEVLQSLDAMAPPHHNPTQGGWASLPDTAIAQPTSAAAK